MARLSGKVAIITGAASGIGLATAEIFATEGAKVVVTDISEATLSSAVEAIKAAGGDVLGHTLDVSSPESWERVVADVVAQWGTIDILVNNAGIAPPKGLLDTTLDEWNKVIAINATGTWLGMKSVIPAMQEGGHGSIVNVSSLAAIISGPPDGGGAAYSASKGAVRSLTKHAANYFAKDSLRVNSVHPGPIYTNLIKNYGISKEQAADPVNSTLPPYIGEATDIAHGILYLASDEAKFVTGEELIIDGGYAAH
ncbi:glucose 1-dehydrogenase [Clavibacter michiganensis subsp. phaseoli]|uniref:Glucose 1-dehydrogenase n=1 Tax=Clavibacter phaseoli TaxID=1734031 RepID=A0A8I0S3P3_9MICO|nr:glucose 1-dehydrogenase [Clavibacter phaseoli]MBF4629634.1 glucose 1-dehydrogenase [Clavibacter phaseoli]